ncbi:MAG: nucleoid occlusion factor SlmA, partial [Pseudomonadota bacterium]|nr:nucleoid occlusion factor SlmA [Pseudomonadota bacterium]
VEKIIAMLLSFSEKNPGMTRVLTGEAVVGEDSRLRGRVAQLQEKLERTLEQSLTQVNEIPLMAPAFANMLLCFVVGRWYQYSSSDFRRSPLGEWPKEWLAFVGSASVTAAN